MRRFVVFCLLLFCFAVPAAPPAVWAKSSGGSAAAVKVPPNYVALSKVRLAVQMDENRQYRMLELEAWVAFKTPEEAAKLGAVKVLVTEAMKEDFLGYNWEAFTDPVEGVELAKTIVKDCVHRILKNGPEPEDILIRSMLMR